MTGRYDSPFAAVPGVTSKTVKLNSDETPRSAPRRARGRGFTLIELPVVRQGKRGAFTLIELLVVIAIIGLLVSILVPSLSSARELARRAVCQTNLHNLGLGMASYLHDNDSTFPWVAYDPYAGYYSRRFPMEVISEYLELMDKDVVDGGIAPDLVLCPSCQMNTNPPNGTIPWNAGMRHYSWNAGLDSANIWQYYPYSDNLVSSNCVGNGSVGNPWPCLPGRSSAYFLTRSVELLTTPGSVSLYRDSNEGPATGLGSGNYYDWKMSSQRAMAESDGGNGRIPNRHNDGGNMVFLDGHVEWKATSWLQVSSNQDEWLLEPDLNNGNVWKAQPKN